MILGGAGGTWADVNTCGAKADEIYRRPRAAVPSGPLVVKSAGFACRTGPWAPWPRPAFPPCPWPSPCGSAVPVGVGEREAVP